eukprot:Pompholyxophrys_punicea_v1_NODE_1_length_14747_cov_12.267901.p6 type:complete len:300 gc:universal NODE_1_length_14747_cov_12.267901:13583-14482(+)
MYWITAPVGELYRSPCRQLLNNNPSMPMMRSCPNAMPFTANDPLSTHTRHSSSCRLLLNIECDGLTSMLRCLLTNLEKLTQHTRSNERVRLCRWKYRTSGSIHVFSNITKFTYPSPGGSGENVVSVWVLLTTFVLIPIRSKQLWVIAPSLNIPISIRLSSTCSEMSCDSYSFCDSNSSATSTVFLVLLLSRYTPTSPETMYERPRITLPAPTTNVLLVDTSLNITYGFVITRGCGPISGRCGLRSGGGAIGRLYGVSAALNHRVIHTITSDTNTNNSMLHSIWAILSPPKISSVINIKN